MKYTKIIVGIIMIILAIVIFLQALFTAAANPDASARIFSMTAEIVIAVLYLASGILYLCTFRLDSMVGDSICLGMMIISWIIAMLMFKIYLFLQLWGWLALIIGIGFFVWHFIENRD
ncbi:hypothetical protein [Limosilactobacillus agrestimuris]|uniref:hypothetical protein n=1 Tax=Limosilactobacillus agrestimuris TaxID=2941331 RepID=UPI00203C4B80|nr:hypothetical protein [Limosilactobacillus agrestimuris]